MATKQKHKLSRAARQEERAGLLFILAPIVGFLCFMLFPICFSIVLSFQSWTGIGDMRFVGFDNFVELFTTPTFWHSLGNTFFYLIGIPIGMVIALFLAMGMNRKIPGVRILRTMYYVPVVSSLVAVSVLWNQIYTQNGLLNAVLDSLFGIEGPAWLYDPGTVKWAIIIFTVWKGVGGTTVLYLAGLQNINRSYYEAAEIDGANGWKRFTRITFPLLTPISFYIIITTIISGLQIYVEINVLATGARDFTTCAITVVYYIYDVTFNQMAGARMGYGAAISWILTIIILIVTLIQFKVQNKWVYSAD